MTNDPGMRAPVTMPKGVPMGTCHGCGAAKSTLALFRIDRTVAKFCRSCVAERAT